MPPKSSAQLSQIAAGYMLASANAAKREREGKSKPKGKPTSKNQHKKK